MTRARLARMRAATVARLERRAEAALVRASRGVNAMALEDAVLELVRFEAATARMQKLLAEWGGSKKRAGAPKSPGRRPEKGS